MKIKSRETLEKLYPDHEEKILNCFIFNDPKLLFGRNIISEMRVENGKIFIKKWHKLGERKA